ncbi:MAG: hypothetical protein ACI4JZ_00875, partial [Oscillospiraceae bacterium]
VNKLLDGAPQKEKRRGKSQVRFAAPPKLYMNSLNALIKRIREDKIPCELFTEKSDKFYEYTIKFPINT